MFPLNSKLYVDACPCCGAHASQRKECHSCGHTWQAADSFLGVDHYVSLNARNALPSKYFERKLSSRIEIVRAHVRPGMHLLEVGCAEGELGRRIKALFPLTYSGVEPSRDAEAARCHLDEVYQDCRDLPTDEPLFDAILCFHALEHIDDIGQEVTRWHSLLRKTGWLLVEVPLRGGHPDIAFDINPEHVHHFTWASLACLFERVGFDIVTMSRGHFESPTYPDSLRILAVPRQDANVRRARLLQRFSSVPTPFAVFGLGGDFRNYVQPHLDQLSIAALLDNNPKLIGSVLNGFQVESYSPSCHGHLPILVCSIRYEDSILTSLRQQGHSARQIYLLADVYDGTSQT